MSYLPDELIIYCSSKLIGPHAYLVTDYYVYENLDSRSPGKDRYSIHGLLEVVDPPEAAGQLPSGGFLYISREDRVIEDFSGKIWGWRGIVNAALLDKKLKTKGII